MMIGVGVERSSDDLAGIVDFTCAGSDPAEGAQVGHDPMIKDKSVFDRANVGDCGPSRKASNDLAKIVNSVCVAGHAGASKIGDGVLNCSRGDGDRKTRCVTEENEPVSPPHFSPSSACRETWPFGGPCR